MTSGHVLCFSEDPSLVPELVALGRTAASGPEDRVSLARIPFSGSPSPSEAPAGTDRVYQVSAPEVRLESPESMALALARVIECAHPTLVLVSSTKRGREYAARLAGLVDGAAVTGVSKVSVTPTGVRVTREMLSGNAIGEEAISGRLPIVAVAPGSFPSAARADAPPPVTEVTVDLPPPAVVLVERRAKPAGALRIEAAERIVAVGRGLQKKADLGLIEQLARGLGAVVGCTRPVAAEAGWLSDDHWIGLTGHRVRPKLYVAVGISGAVQHLVGMRDSEVVVAINKDASAPIFAHADYRVVGDLYALVPALVSALGASSV